MAIKVYSDKDLPQETWDRLIGDSFFLSSRFVSLWRTKNSEPMYYVDEVDGSIIAGIAGLVNGSGFFKRFDSMPDGLYGGPCFVPDYDTNKKHKFLTSFGNYLKKNNFLRANINKPSIGIGLKMFKTQPALEHVLKLSDQGTQPLPRGIGTDVRGSLKRGARVEIFDNETDIEQLHDLAIASSKRQNRKLIYSKEFFHRLLKNSIGNNNILWLKAMLENKMIASQITFFEKDKALNWSFYFDKEYSYYKPGYLLVDYALDYSIKNGIKQFSMGGTPGNIESVTKYKERWGCTEQTYDNYTYKSFLGKLICGWRRR